MKNMIDIVSILYKEEDIFYHVQKNYPNLHNQVTKTPLYQWIMNPYEYVTEDNMLAIIMNRYFTYEGYCKYMKKVYHFHCALIGNAPDMLTSHLYLHDRGIIYIDNYQILYISERNHKLLLEVIEKSDVSRYITLCGLIQEGSPFSEHYLE